MTFRERADRAAFWLTAGAAITVLLSIAVSQIFLGMAIVALLLARTPWRMPPIQLPLLLFVLGTILAILFSGHIREGWPQVKKFYVFLLLPVAYTTFRKTEHLRGLVLAWTVIGTIAAFASVEQFALKFLNAQKLGRDFYLFYMERRTTGFMSHWMTFSGEQMIILMMLLALLLFAMRPPRAALLWIAALLLVGSLLLSFTRNSWLGALGGAIYLIARWRARWLAAIPVLLVIGFLVAPPPLRDRMTSFLRPRGEADSNRHRLYTFRTGLRMVEAHPWLGLGPEQIKPQFDNYMPEDLPRKKPEGWYGHLHNIYLQYAAERGVPTMLCLMWLIGKVLYDFSRGAAERVKGEPRVYVLGAIAAIIAILIAGLFEYNLGDSEVLTLFLTVVAIGYAALRDREEVPHGV